MWKKLRISILLFILFLVGADTYMTKYRAVSWDETLWVAVYPINSSKDPKIDRYIANLSNRNFESIERFFKREADEQGLVIEQPFRMMLAHTVYELPPEPPGQDSNVLEIALWSLKLRYWAWSQDNSDFSPHIKVFVIFHDYNQNKKLAHSLGMEKGMIGVVHGFAHREMEGKNNLVIAHEMLHTIGATDKYHPESGEPVYPDGFAEPDRSPRFPQRYTELMGGRTPINETTSIMPRNLNSVKVGKVTAQEINWFSQ
jgi:hypothetical protein